jgi:hypothetical protein
VQRTKIFVAPKITNPAGAAHHNISSINNIFKPMFRCAAHAKLYAVLQLQRFWCAVPFIIKIIRFASKGMVEEKVVVKNTFLIRIIFSQIC